MMTTKSKVIHVQFSIPKQHQILISLAARVKFIETKVISRYYTKDVSNQVSSNSDFIHIQIPVLKWDKKKKCENIFWVKNRGSLRGFKLGQKITNRGGDFKSRQKDFKSRKDRFQIGAGITNRCKMIKK